MDVQFDISSIYFGLQTLKNLEEEFINLSSAMNGVTINSGLLSSASLFETAKKEINNATNSTIHNLVTLLDNSKKILEQYDREAALLFQYYEQGVLTEDGKWTAVPLMNQDDYADIKYSQGTVKTSGCGITSLCMLASYITGELYTPEDLATIANENGSSNIDRMTYAADLVGLNWTRDNNTSREDLVNYLKEGKMVICLVKSSSHFVLCTGVTEDGQILVNDPYSPFRQESHKDGYDWGELQFSAGSTWVFDPTSNTGSTVVNDKVSVDQTVLDKLAEQGIDLNAMNDVVPENVPKTQPVEEATPEVVEEQSNATTTLSQSEPEKTTTQPIESDLLTKEQLLEQNKTQSRLRQQTLKEEMYHREKDTTTSTNNSVTTTSNSSESTQTSTNSSTSETSSSNSSSNSTNSNSSSSSTSSSNTSGRSTSQERTQTSQNNTSSTTTNNQTGTTSTSNNSGVNSSTKTNQSTNSTSTQINTTTKTETTIDQSNIKENTTIEQTTSNEQILIETESTTETLKQESIVENTEIIDTKTDVSIDNNIDNKPDVVEETKVVEDTPTIEQSKEETTIIQQEKVQETTVSSESETPIQERIIASSTNDTIQSNQAKSNTSTNSTTSNATISNYKETIHDIPIDTTDTSIELEKQNTEETMDYETTKDTVYTDYSINSSIDSSILVDRTEEQLYPTTTEEHNVPNVILTDEEINKNQSTKTTTPEENNSWIPGAIGIATIAAAGLATVGAVKKSKKNNE